MRKGRLKRLFRQALFIVLLFTCHVALLAAEPNCNKLGKEKSPYLQQHRKNPVCWQPWNNEAFARAKKLNKPIFLSIGYSTCYWCHAMEEESFKVQAVAKLMNRHFINIKVDREERPDVDQLYMDAVVKLTGAGGWPMSVFLTPEGKPFWGGTYFKREQFVKIIEQLGRSWKKDKGKIEKTAQVLTDRLKKQRNVRASVPLDVELLDKAVATYQRSYDKEYGGFGNAPKFPPHQQLSFLMRYHLRRPDADVLEMVHGTLKAMAWGGMYDHIGGGFARYSVDKAWNIPHFEKMLYDNALLASTYIEAFQLTGKVLYASVAQEILDYVLSEMTGKGGGFYSAQDAGSVGAEGEFYVWTYSELQEIFSEKEFQLFTSHYHISKDGNFEHKTNVFTLHPEADWESKYNPELFVLHQKLYEKRKERKVPRKDDKILTAWNGLMISAFSKGYQVLGEARYLLAAKNAARFLKQKLFVNERLLRRYRDGEARFEAYAEDYAYLIEGLLHLFEASQEGEWFSFARQLQATQDKLFWDTEHAGYYVTYADDVLVRQKDFSDGALPSANATSLINLYRFYGYTFDRSYAQRATKLLTEVAELIRQHPHAYPKFLQGLEYAFNGGREVVLIKGDNTPVFEAMKEKVYVEFLPHKVFVTSEVNIEEYPELELLVRKKAEKSLTTFYVCRDQICLSPETEFSNMKKKLKDFHTVAHADED